ncbi:acidic leucine-rich nuclear phosphoprotein 32 family member B-like [Homarus americanus]|uniref:acidic leucine-rich nuclear phosphoprotein 32 family member B-like n=1 Tax=Homarus americanus TaxID=6706 RepID=UPI001C484BC3|nr:acidic leucine-rich nuclear phosphoprotein 32 family member B-like [Homarus americanus]
MEMPDDPLLDTSGDEAPANIELAALQRDYPCLHRRLTSRMVVSPLWCLFYSRTFRIKKKKEKAKRAGNKEDEEEGEEEEKDDDQDDDSDVDDDVTQNIIDELPDPDKYYSNDLEDGEENNKYDSHSSDGESSSEVSESEEEEMPKISGKRRARDST